MESLDPKKIRALTGLSQVDFGKLLGVSRNSVALWETNDLEKRTKPKLNAAIRMKEIEKRILNGEKDFLFNNSFKEGIKDKLKTDEILGEGKIINENLYPSKTVTIIPIKGRGGLENAFYDKLYINKMKKEELTLKEPSSNGSEWFKIEVEGVSMDDSTADFDGSKYSLAEGDWVYCRSIPKTNWRDKLHFNKVKIFCFFHNTRGIIFKKVKNHNPETGELLLTSLNPDKKRFPDFTINISECSYVLRVLDVLSSYR